MAQYRQDKRGTPVRELREERPVIPRNKGCDTIKAMTM